MSSACAQRTDSTVTASPQPSILRLKTISRLAKKRPAAKAKAAASKGRCKLTAATCRAIVSRLMSSHGDAPQATKPLLTRLMKRLKGKKDVDLEVYEHLRTVVQDVHLALQRSVEEQLAFVEGEDEDKQERLKAQAEAELQVEELKHDIAQRKEELEGTTKSIEDEQKSLSAAKAGVKKAMAEINVKEGKMRQLEALEADVLAPFKDHQAKGSDGTNRLKGLKKVGKEFDFHPELLMVIPNVLRKQPEKRRTFDNVAIQQLDAEFSKRAQSIQASVKEGEIRLAETTAAMDSAHTALASAKETKKRKIRELASAETELESCRAALQAAKRHVGRFDKDRKQAEKLLAQRRQCLEKFEQGPLAKIRRTDPVLADAEEEDTLP